MGLGVSELSVTPRAIEAVDRALAGVDRQIAEGLAGRALRAATLDDLRSILNGAAEPARRLPDQVADAG